MGYLESISLHRIAPREVTGTETAADLIDHAFSSYNAGRLREVCTVFTHKFLEPDCTVGLTLSGALTPAGLGMSCLIPLIKAGFVDWIVSTGANLYHDTHYALDLPLHQSRPNLDDLALRHNDVIRIYDIVFDYKTLLDTDAFYRELIRDESLPGRWGPPSFTTRSGDTSTAVPRSWAGRRHSLLAAAFEADVPIYTSSPGDSSIGMNLAALEPARRQAPDRYAPRRQRDRRHRLCRQARGRQVGRPDPGRRQPQELHPPDRAADPGSPRALRERPRLFPPDHRRPARHRRPLGATASEAMTWGKVDPETLARFGDLLHRLDHRPAALDGLRPAPATPRGRCGGCIERRSSDLRDRSGREYEDRLRAERQAGLARARSGRLSRDFRTSASRADLHVSRTAATRVIVVDPDEPDPAALEQAARILRRGGLVAFATETVYGLGAIATDPRAVARIFAARDGRRSTR